MGLILEHTCLWSLQQGSSLQMSNRECLYSQKNPTHIWKTPSDNVQGVFITYLNYTSRKVMLINSLMYEGNIQISEYEGTYLTLI